MQKIILLFPLWALLASGVAWGFDEFFVSLKGMIVPLLMLVMLAMGLTLNYQDFLKVWRLKRIVAVGVGLQYLLMPFAAFVISRMLQLSLELTIGMMLVGVTAGGTASNVMTFLAKGNLALSVSMTFVSTLLAIVLMPLLTQLYLGKSVDVPALKMLLSMLQIVLAPIVLGVLLNHFFAKSLEPLTDWFALFASFSIVLIVAIVVALNVDQLYLLSGALILAVVLHNLIGLLSGYQISRWLGYDSVIARTVAIEVAMQNSGLSVAMALNYFSAAAALPAALFSIWHNLSGAIFASFWQRKKPIKQNSLTQDNK